MITIDKIHVHGWEAAIRGARNPMNSWAKSDSIFDNIGVIIDIGPNDEQLMMKLRNAGSDHRKFMRMINVTMDITAPLFWWKEFDTYKVATVRNSCSTMHKIHAEPITHLDFGWIPGQSAVKDVVVSECEYLRKMFVETKEEHYWRDLIEILPSSYLQKATVQVNYETLLGMYKNRKNHKLKEWRYFCLIMEALPVSKLIIGE